MEQIQQLKTMRDEALERLQINPDYKLVTSLDTLIGDLEASFGATAPEAVEAAIADLNATDSNQVDAAPEAAIEEADGLIDDLNLEEQVEKSLDEDLAALGQEPDLAAGDIGTMAN